MRAKVVAAFKDEVLSFNIPLKKTMNYRNLTVAVSFEDHPV
jgi:hypothetical protein